MTENGERCRRHYQSVYERSQPKLNKGRALDESLHRGFRRLAFLNIFLPFDQHPAEHMAMRLAVLAILVSLHQRVVILSPGESPPSKTLPSA